MGVIINVKKCYFKPLYQGRHGWQGPQGLGLAWILQNKKWRGQQRHAADVSDTVAALPAKTFQLIQVNHEIVVNFFHISHKLT